MKRPAGKPRSLKGMRGSFGLCLLAVHFDLFFEAFAQHYFDDIGIIVCLDAGPEFDRCAE